MALAIPIQAELNSKLSTAHKKSELPLNSIPEYFAIIQEKLSNANTSLQISKPWTTTGSERADLLLPQICTLLDLFDLLEPVIPTKIQELIRILGWDGKQLHITCEKFRAFTICSDS